MNKLRVSLLAALMLSPALSLAADTGFKINIREHRFEPAEITVPAGQKVKLLVTNLDATPEEFESRQLGREKVVAAGKTVTINIGPLKAGEYPFAGEYNEATAKGKVIAK